MAAALTRQTFTSPKARSNRLEKERSALEPPKSIPVAFGSPRGLIDVYSHLGVYPSPDVAAHSDGNEGTAPVTAEVWAEHSL